MLRQNLLCGGTAGGVGDRSGLVPPRSPLCLGHPIRPCHCSRAGRQAPRELSVLLLLDHRSKWVGRTSCDLKTVEHSLGVPGES